ncbi:hypothetical protein ACFWUQ_26645 [Streptomyces sp. NPDC058662]|uniref:hypothetical protein n=1 Tax=Streptomyces sp. NPDC058662 TaxID=3346583 RepID=UPI0036540332
MFDLIRSETVVCTFCKATPADGAVRTLSASQGRLSVTWHAETCPHYAADLILASDDQ